MSLHGRDYAIDVLNKWYDLMNVSEENRIEYEEIKGPEGETIKTKEKDDIVRERVILAIRKKLLSVENGEFVLKLEDPVVDKQGVVKLASVTIRKKYKHKHFRRVSSKVDVDNPMSYMDAKLAARLGISLTMLGEMYDDDVDVVQAVTNLFSRVG